MRYILMTMSLHVKARYILKVYSHCLVRHVYSNSNADPGKASQSTLYPVEKAQYNLQLSLIIIINGLVVAQTRNVPSALKFHKKIHLDTLQIS